jgi:hypothetical protein
MTHEERIESALAAMKQREPEVKQKYVERDYHIRVYSRDPEKIAERDWSGASWAGMSWSGAGWGGGRER